MMKNTVRLNKSAKYRRIDLKKIECSRCKKKVDLPKLIDQAMESIGNIAKLYTEGNIITKRKIIGSAFPDKFEFDGDIGRTARVNILLSYILQINSNLGA
jgi:hypothetical protein